MKKLKIDLPKIKQIMPETEYLNRFTTLPYLLEILSKQEIVLINPLKWEDYNDTEILADYKSKQKNCVSLVALCFTHGRETIHHWKAFSSGESGCCIEFNKTKLLKQLEKIPSIQHRKVSYKLLGSANTVNHNDVPFTKRQPYECEQEYRVILELNEEVSVYPIKISLECIEKITLSPYLPEPTFKSIKMIIQKLVGHAEIEVNHSTLFKNKEWISGFVNRTKL